MMITRNRLMLGGFGAMLALLLVSAILLFGYLIGSGGQSESQVERAATAVPSSPSVESPATSTEQPSEPEAAAPMSREEFRARLNQALLNNWSFREEWMAALSRIEREQRGEPHADAAAYIQQRPEEAIHVVAGQLATLCPPHEREVLLRICRSPSVAFPNRLEPIFSEAIARMTDEMLDRFHASRGVY